MKSHHLPVLLISALFWPTKSSFGADLDVSTFLGGELWDSTTAAGHGILSIRSDFSGLPHGSHAYVEYNTDTLRLGLNDYSVGGDTVVGCLLTGEAGLSNLLADYFFEGDNDPTRGFFASYLLGSIWAKFNPLSSIYITADGSARRWFFSPTELTDPTLVLPKVALAIEPSLQVTWWRLSDDLAWNSPHRLFPRLNGYAVGAGVRFVFVSEADPWGGLDSGVISDERVNTPNSQMILLNQWAHFGREFSPRSRIELSESASFMSGEDDLYRTVIGGMSPYSINVPGIPWGYFHGDDFLAVSGRIAYELPWVVDMEVGPVLGAISMRDASRTGGVDITSLYGYGLYGDFRVGHWQYDLRGGFSPSLNSDYENQDAWTLFIMVGWSTM